MLPFGIEHRDFGGTRRRCGSQLKPDPLCGPTLSGEELRSILLGTAGLDAAVVVSLYLTLGRGNVESSPAQLHSAVRLVVVAILLQAGHFAEEVTTGFHTRFPELLGLSAWSLGFFTSFNIAWLVIWSFSALGLSARLHAALFPIWFLGIGCAMNGIAHPLLSLITGAYFPGLVTSPLVGLAGVMLLRHLLRLTAHATA